MKSFRIARVGLSVRSAPSPSPLGEYSGLDGIEEDLKMMDVISFQSLRQAYDWGRDHSLAL